MDTYEISDPSHLASFIDHTLLKPDVTAGDIVKLCAEARERTFTSVCVNPFWVRRAKEELAGTTIKVGATVGFPLGAGCSRSKQFEAAQALEDGAVELDMVQNIGALRSGDEEAVREEIGAIAKLTHEQGAILKVILETCLLTDLEKERTCRLAVEAGADFVKTSTGFSTAGATTADVRLMRSIVGKTCGVKASGGIKTLSVMREMLMAGANRIGTSSGVRILDELSQELSHPQDSNGGESLKTARLSSQPGTAIY